MLKGMHSTTVMVVMKAALLLAARACESCCCDLQNERECVCSCVYWTVPYIIHIRPYKRHHFRSTTVAAMLSTLNGPESPLFHKVEGVTKNTRVYER